MRLASYRASCTCSFGVPVEKQLSPKTTSGGEHVHGMSVMPSNGRLCMQSFEQVARSVEDRRSAWERVREASCDVEWLLTSRVEQEQQAGGEWTQGKRTARKQSRLLASYLPPLSSLVSITGNPRNFRQFARVHSFYGPGVRTYRDDDSSDRFR